MKFLRHFDSDGSVTFLSNVEFSDRVQQVDEMTETEQVRDGGDARSFGNQKEHGDKSASKYFSTASVRYSWKGVCREIMEIQHFASP